MKIYLDANEIVELGQEADSIRFEITDLMDAEILEAIQLIKDIMAGKEYSFNRHFCGHEENKTCVLEEV